MKEFIEKLIGRLEEYKDSHLVEHDSEQCEHCVEKPYNDCEGTNCTLCVWDKAIEIVNQLAEEYKDKEYCWQECASTEHCKECSRLGNGDIDYFESIDDWAESLSTIDAGELLGNSEQVKKTNADRIRAMSDEELYNLIEKVKMCGGLLRAEESSSECKGCKDGFCCNVLYWLQSEAE